METGLTTERVVRGHGLRWRVVLWVALPVVSGLAGCASQVLPVVDQPSVASPVLEQSLPGPALSERRDQAQEQEQRRQRAIERLLADAQASLARRELTTPESRNAWIYYQQILKIDAAEPRALQGLEKIVETYVVWADAAMQKGDQASARTYLLRAAQVLPESAALAAAQRRLQAVPASIRKGDAGAEDPAFRPIDRQQLALRSPALVRQLSALADEVRARNSRVQILAPDDQQGRWIYQQLNDRHEAYRVRASLLIAPRPGVRLLD